jgi:hypothetical protein
MSINLIEALGITKEDYLGFVAQQHIYKDEKIGTSLEITNDFGVVALVLTIVGTLFQVASALLLPSQKRQTCQAAKAPHHETMCSRRDLASTAPSN